VMPGVATPKEWQTSVVSKNDARGKSETTRKGGKRKSLTAGERN